MVMGRPADFFFFLPFLMQIFSSQLFKGHEEYYDKMANLMHEKRMSNNLFIIRPDRREFVR